MRVGALIVAAGMSSRMGDFKPMLNIGNISIAQRTITNFQQAGIDKIAMVTGYNALALERHLSGDGVVFLRNENYETTQMFDSVKIGLEYLKDKCDIILFTPVDIPLFTADTISKLVDSGAELACPVCEGRRGHPILIGSGLVDIILEDSGEQGLKGALERCNVPMKLVEVEDQGILHDADTPEDYDSLLKYHNSHLIRPVVSVSLAREKVFFDDKMAMLLTLVDETGSVRAACSRMQISYSSGWKIIKTLESQLSYPLIERFQGGSSGGSSSLTDEGRKLLSAYGHYRDKLKETAQALFNEEFGNLL